MVSRIRGVLGARPYLYGVVAGAMMFMAVYIVDAAMAHFRLRPEATVLDDLLLAIVTAILVVSLEKQHERAIRLQKARLTMIIEMNHHIRNALQSIIYASASMEGDKAVVIRNSSKRIEWALKEVLPGEKPAPESTESHVNY